jgi:hypothetical protein
MSNRRGHTRKTKVKGAIKCIRVKPTKTKKRKK